MPRQAAELAIPLGIVAILVVMMIPLPPLLLDFMLALNITLGVIILLVSMNVLKPLNFSLFPTVILITTLYRLALNVASTRLILLHGDEGTEAAGKVIQSFGSFVVGGNFAVGLVIFVILVIINFVVITKGAGRIAEVSARFTLDAMPGKQMSIDADLNAGLITDAEARSRRLEVSREADFYGAMDGASKFVRGDAVAGILITVINIIGGISIGVIQQGMAAEDAITVYSILTIGDGLVAQVPALIISTAAGIIVTRAASENKLSTEFGAQIFRHPRALASAAGVLGVLGLVPGLPHVAFLMLAAITGAVAYVTSQGEAERVKAEAKAAAAAAAKPVEKEETFEVAPIDALSMEVGYRLIPLVDASAGGELLGRIKAMRKQAANETGFLVPPIHIKDNLQLKPEEYVFLLKGVEVGRGEVMSGSSLAIDPGNAKKGLEGRPTKEPAFGLPAMWIQDSQKEKAKLLGYTVVSPAIVMVTHLTEIVRSNAHEILTRQDVQTLLDGLKNTHPKVVEELVPGLMSTGAVQKVLKNLLKERVPIRDILTIVETLADYAPFIKDTDRLTEFVRQALARAITKLMSSPDNTVTVMMLDPRAEEAVAKSVHETQQGTTLALAPSVAEKLLTRVSEGMQAMAGEGHQPILVVSSEIRRYMRGLTERVLPSLVVLSTGELSGNVKIKNYKVVSIS
jgi:flagellar biosynthesis protein FlhA